MVGALPAPSAALRSGLRAASLRASSGSGWAEEAPALGMIPTGAVEPAVSPSSQPGTVAQKKRRAAESASESEPSSSSSAEELLSSDEDEAMPSSKRVKHGAAGPELRRTTRAAARDAAGGTAGVPAKSSKVAEQKRAARRSTTERVVAASNSEKDEPARPAPGKSARRRVASAEHPPEADEGAAAAAGAMLPPPPPLPPVKQVITAAGALRGKEAVLEVCAFHRHRVRPPLSSLLAARVVDQPPNALGPQWTVTKVCLPAIMVAAIKRKTKSSFTSVPHQSSATSQAPAARRAGQGLSAPPLVKMPDGTSAAAAPWQPQPAAGAGEDEVAKLHAELKHQLALQVLSTANLRSTRSLRPVYGSILCY